MELKSLIFLQQNWPPVWHPAAYLPPGKLSVVLFFCLNGISVVFLNF